MTDEQFEELKQVLFDATHNASPCINCFTCLHCDVYKSSPIRFHCNLHNYDLYDEKSFCFQYKPLKKE